MKFLSYVLSFLTQKTDQESLFQFHSGQHFEDWAAQRINHTCWIVLVIPITS